MSATSINSALSTISAPSRTLPVRVGGARVPLLLLLSSLALFCQIPVTSAVFVALGSDDFNYERSQDSSHLNKSVSDNSVAGILRKRLASERDMMGGEELNNGEESNNEESNNEESNNGGEELNNGEESNNEESNNGEESNNVQAEVMGMGKGLGGLGKGKGKGADKMKKIMFQMGQSQDQDSLSDDQADQVSQSQDSLSDDDQVDEVAQNQNQNQNQVSAFEEEEIALQEDEVAQNQNQNQNQVSAFEEEEALQEEAEQAQAQAQAQARLTEDQFLQQFKDFSTTHFAKLKLAQKKAYINSIRRNQLKILTPITINTQKMADKIFRSLLENHLDQVWSALPPNRSIKEQINYQIDLRCTKECVRYIAPKTGKNYENVCYQGYERNVLPSTLWRRYQNTCDILEDQFAEFKSILPMLSRTETLIIQCTPCGCHSKCQKMAEVCGKNESVVSDKHRILFSKLFVASKFLENADMIELLREFVKSKKSNTENKGDGSESLYDSVMEFLNSFGGFFEFADKNNKPEKINKIVKEFVDTQFENGSFLKCNREHDKAHLGCPDYGDIMELAMLELTRRGVIGCVNHVTGELTGEVQDDCLEPNEWGFKKSFLEQ